MIDFSHRIRERADRGRFVLPSRRSLGSRLSRRSPIEFYFQALDDGTGPLSTTGLDHAKTWSNRLAASLFLRQHLDRERWEVVKR